MVPSSAAIEAPTRPASIRAVRTGPSSLTSETPTTAPTMVCTPNRRNWKYVCAAMTIPVNAPVVSTTGSERFPTW